MAFADAFSGKRGSKIDMRSFASALARAGRGQDTMLAHITPREAQVLDGMGSGTINPETGLREYGGEPGAGRGGAGEGGPGGGPGGGGGGGGNGGTGGSGRGGGGGPGRGRGSGGTAGSGRGGGSPRGGPSPADAPGNVGGGFGGPQGSVGRGGRGSGGTSHRDAPANVRGSVGGPPSVGASHTAEAAAARDLERRMIERAISVPFDLAFGNPFGLFSRQDEETGLTGTLGAVRDIAETIGAGIGAFGGPSAGTVGPADPNAPGATGVAGPGDVSGGQELSPVSQPFTSPGLERPEELPFPRFLGLSDAMTPLQQRSRIATFGTAGEEGAFRGQEAQDVFKNILLRSILDAQNQIAPNARILPIEAQYARQVMGSDVSQDQSVENFARTLMGLPERVPDPTAELLGVG